METEELIARFQIGGILPTREQLAPMLQGALAGLEAAESDGVECTYDAIRKRMPDRKSYWHRSDIEEALSLLTRCGALEGDAETGTWQTTDAWYTANHPAPTLVA